MQEIPSTTAPFGVLYNQDILLHRRWFIEMTKLIGINCVYYAPLPGKHFNRHGDLLANYQPGRVVGCIFEDHPTQKSLKKMGWVAELQEGASIIHVPYDLTDLQVGALFELPSGIDNTPGRLFRVISMQNIMLYPASIACEVAPEYYSADEPHLTKEFSQSNTNLLIDLEGDD